MFESSIPASVNHAENARFPLQAIPEQLVPLNGLREDALFVKSNKTLYVREMVMNLLLLASNKLPKGVKLGVQNAWQSQAPYDSGGVVEVFLVDEVGKRLEMGREFPLRAYEEKRDALSSEEEVFLHNRRLLYHSMNAVGFVAKTNVWWHFEFGTPYWADVKEKPAFYGAVSPQ